MDRFYVIDLNRSIDKGQTIYWCSNGYGYTSELKEAGTFSYTKAKKYCNESSINGVAMLPVLNL